MSYRTVKINWLPKSKRDWDTFTAARTEVADLWSWLVERHADARQTGESWPSRDDLQKETKKQYPNLHSQSVQMTVHDFLESIASAEALRSKGMDYEYPHKKTRYRQVIFNGQAAVVRDGRLVLPCGKAGKLKIRIPDNVEFPGRIMEVRLNCGDLHVVCIVADESKPIGSTIGVDLGVNTLIAATDGNKAILVSGREMKATIQLRNKKLAEIVSKQSHKTKGSRRHKRLQRRKFKMLKKTKNKTTDLCHKATRKIANAFPNAKAYVGEPFNAACQKIGKVWAQQVSSACNRIIINQLNYKLAAAIEVNEACSSQTCPSCGKRSKHRRTFSCRCGLKAPRDLVGCLNIRAIGIDGKMLKGRGLPKTIHWKHPSKYPGTSPGSPADAGHVAR